MTTSASAEKLGVDITPTYKAKNLVDFKSKPNLFQNDTHLLPPNAGYIPVYNKELDRSIKKKVLLHFGGKCYRLYRLVHNVHVFRGNLSATILWVTYSGVQVWQFLTLFKFFITI